METSLELIFNRALVRSFSRKKLILVFPALVLSGLIIVLCHTLAVDAHSWIRVSLTFFPAFICTAILMAIGIPLVRMYHNEVKQVPFSYTEVIRSSWGLMLGFASYAVVLILAYFVLWIVMGLFYLLKTLPMIGQALGVILSFGPFLLIFGSLVLSAISLFMIFFMTPCAALRSSAGWDVLEESSARLKRNPFDHFKLLVIGVFPVVCFVGLLVLAAALTGMTYYITERTFAIFAQWFFIMIPFAALLSPAAVFLFNFAAESCSFLQKKSKQTTPLIKNKCAFGPGPALNSDENSSQ